MFKFLFGKPGAKAVNETQRQTVTRALEEINGVLAAMPDKPRVAVDLNTGLIAVDLPEHMPDEALALPAPEEKPAPDAEKAAEDATADKADETPSEDTEEKKPAA